MFYNTLMQLDKRAHTLLKTLIERYIEDGVPVGSKALAQISGLDLSSATIRNIMADLEHMGFVSSPHTSAGRVPTPLGYRFFVDTLLVSDALPDPHSPHANQQLAAYLHNQVSALHQHVPGNSPQKLIASAAQTLSSLSRFAGVVLAPKRDTTFHQIEFVRLAEKKILVVIVSPNGEIQNRLLLTSTDYTASMLTEAANYLTHNFRSLDFAEIRRRLQLELKQLQSDMTTLMQDAVDAGSEAVSDQGDDIVISGERNLFSVSELSSNMTSLHQMVNLFEKKTHLMQLLDLSGRASGIRIYIGGESDLVPVDQMSVIASGYEVNGKVVGTLGVIGPTRMAYDKMIPIVEITAKLLSNALSQNS